MAEYYIASRNDWTTISKVAGGRVGKLNTGMSNILRDVALKQGIKKTQQGKKLEFYSVSKDQLDLILDPATPFMLKLEEGLDFRPLLTVDGAKMQSAVSNVNSQYGGRMDRATHSKYIADLFKAVEDSVFKVNEDTKTEKKKYHNPGYQVGDFITHSEGHHSRVSFPAVITKITEAGYQYQVYRPSFTVQTSGDMKGWGGWMTDVKAWGDHWDGEVVVPFLKNKEHFQLHSKKYNLRWTRRTSQFKSGTDDQAVYRNYWTTD